MVIACLAAAVIAGTQMLSAARGRVNRSSAWATFHSTTAFADGREAQTRKGLLGTGASDVQTADSKAVGRGVIERTKSGREIRDAEYEML